MSLTSNINILSMKTMVYIYVDERHQLTQSISSGKKTIIK